MPTDFPGVRARLCRAFLPVTTVIAGFLVTGAASAQVVINSGTSGPISGAGSSVTVTLSGTVQSIGDPGVISAPSGDETTSLVNDGQILASGNLGLGDGYAVWSNGAPIGSITNSGRIDGEARGVSIDNDGVSGVTTLTNNAGGIINGGLQMAVYNGNILGTLTNSGTIQGADGIYSLVTTGTIDNQAGGWIQGGKAIWIDGGTAGAISNAGTVYGGRGLSVSAGAGVATVTNSGAFLGVGDFAVFSSGTLGTLVNSGTFSGTGGIASIAGIDSLSNQAGGKIEGTSAEGVYVSGSAGTITNAAGATIAGASRGVLVDIASSVGAVTNAGTVSGAGEFALFGSGTIGTLTNSGTFSGTGGIASLGEITSLTNQSGGKIEGKNVEGVYIASTAGTVTNAAGATITGATTGVSIASDTTVTSITNAGTITGASEWGLLSSGTIGTLTNSGTFAGGLGGIASSTEIGGLTNQAGGKIEGTADSAVWIGGTAGTVSNAAGATITTAGNAGVHVVGGGTLSLLSNAGEIGNTSASGGWGVLNENVLSSLTNSGTISSSSVSGGGVASFTQMDSLTNQPGGLIEGSSGSGVFVLQGTMTTLTNAGTISGANAGVITDFFSNATIGTLDNSGLITSGTAGIDNGSQINTLTNSGRIEGATAGIWNRNSLESLVNTGTVAYTGSGAGPAIFNNGNLGNQSNVPGVPPAIASTASGALIDGSIVNNGNIFNGFTIANQDVVIAAGDVDGAFYGGTLDVVDGNLTFAAGAGGLLVLSSADVSVKGGAGTFTNDAALVLLDTRQVTGDFLQGSGGSTIIGLNGTAAGQYGRLVVSGMATFGGTLGLYEDTLSLASGQSFELFDFASASGDFSSLEVDFVPATNLGGGVWAYGSLLLTEIWTGTSLSLSVSASAVPEIDPSSFGSALALVLGSLGMLERKARRCVRRTS